MNALIHFVENPLIKKTLSTLIVIAAVALMRHVVVRRIMGREDAPMIVRRRWLVTVRNTAFFIIVVGVSVVWLEQLRTLAASVIVIAAAVVIATKELLLNLTGYLFRSGAQFFSIGDRIEVSQTRGDVIDQSLMGATILEIGPGTQSHQYTGRAVFVPNSIFLSAPVINENYMGDFIFHIITIPLEAQAPWEEHERALLDAAGEVAAPYLNDARAYMKSLEQKHSLDAPTADPRVHVQVPEPGRLMLQLRVPIPARRKSRMEQAILRGYLRRIAEKGLTGKKEDGEPANVD